MYEPSTMSAPAPWFRRGATALTALLACCLETSAAVATNAPDAAPPPSQPSEAKASQHWAYQPIRRPTVPVGGHPIDGFILTRLSEHGLKPSPPAEPADLVRRLYFDLIGLPPTPDELTRYLTDSVPDRYERLVERLLASPHYGERWGRHWLDLARFSESTGFEYDRLRDNAWPYRDYVIRSFNLDKPYDQFMREQIAGDVLEPLTSDGILGPSLLVCGAYDQAGNAQANATQRAITREEEMEDLLSVVGQTFLGLTVNCARCHDHKFDPIPQRDYFRLKSVFDGVKHGERPVEGEAERQSRMARQAAAQARLNEINRDVAHWDDVAWQAARPRRPQAPAEPGPEAWMRWTFEEPGSSTNAMGEAKGGAIVHSGQLELPSAGAYFQSVPIAVDLREKTLEAWVRLSDLGQRGGAAISVETLDGSQFDAITFGERQPGKWTAGSDGFLRTHDLDAPVETAGPDEWVHVAVVYGADRWVTIYRNGEPYGQPYVTENPSPVFKAGAAHIVLGLRHHGGGSPWLTGAIRNAAVYARALSAQEIQAAFRAGGFGFSKEELLAGLTSEQRTASEQALVALQKARQDLLDASRPGPVAYAGIRVQPEPTHRLKRGDVKSPEEVVSPGGLSAVTAISSDFGLPADAPEASRRRRFADWLTDPHNPLPARVMVNRIWQYHFGQGLVATSSDFGVNGARPTHPELLDWLASAFIESGWSIKTVHRWIVTSEAYRQSSRAQSDALRIDADDQWLWRFPPRRLEAEVVRDAMLTVSGELNREFGGPSFRPFTTTDFNATFYFPFDRGDGEFNRRTVYRMNVNSGKDPFLDAFDCPDPSVKTPRRTVTITPLQALGLMNSSFVQRQAEGLARRAEATAGQTGANPILAAYQIVLGRSPSREEAERAETAVRQRGLPEFCWALLNSTEFIYVR